MTFAIGRVSGGTGAGRKRPMSPAAKEWPCICIASTDPYGSVPGGTARYPIRLQGGLTAERRTNPGYLVRCPDCGERAPKASFR